MDGPSNVRPMIEPHADQMLRHLEHLFAGDLDGCHEGKVELAWTDGNDGKLRHAAIFGTDQVDEMVERAVTVNTMPGQNVYVGQALRDPGIPPFGRCKDEDFFALTTFYVDLDDDVVATARINYRHRGCPPTAVVVTGRHPHVRAQMLWRLETPERDADVCRSQNLALAKALEGDLSVINPSRVLRLGGSIAWPTKPGRVLERTEFLIFEDGRPKVYFPGQIAKAFPAEQTAPASATPSPTPSSLNIGSEFDGVSVEACLAEARAGRHWHNNLIRLTAHWIARGWSDEEILSAASALTSPGFTVDQTRREVARMITGGRGKWNIPSLEHQVDETDEPPTPLAPAFIDSLDVAMLPRRRWMLGGTLLRGNVTVVVAPPGVGKSTLGIEQAVAVVTGREITGQTVHEQSKVWIYNNEDDADELRRRLAAVLQHWDIPFSEVRGRLALNSGADRPLLLARLDRTGNVIRLPDVDACIAHIREAGIGVFIVDPFVETHEVNENANDQIKTVAAMFREIARKSDCAVMLVHHTAKPPQGTSDGHAGNMNTARGASALAGVARVVQTLFAMSARDAETHGIGDDDRHFYIRLDDAKANLSLITNKADWFRRVGVTIANGDAVGVLAPEDLETVDDTGDDDRGGENDSYQPVVTALLAQVSEPEITLNAAAKRLAWSGDHRFARFRQTDTKGHQRASRTLRQTILAACRQGVCVVAHGSVAGFTCNETSSPVVLRRFERPSNPVGLAARQSEFGEKE